MAPPRPSTSPLRFTFPKAGIAAEAVLDAMRNPDVDLESINHIA